MPRINTVSLPQVLKFFYLLLLCTLAITAKPAWAIDSSFQEQANPLIEEMRSLQTEGENMDSLRFDSDRLAMCGTVMRRSQPRADSLRERVDALEVNKSEPDSFQASMAKNELSAAASNLNLCVSCLRSATDSCNHMSSSIQTAMDILQGD